MHFAVKLVFTNIISIALVYSEKCAYDLSHDLHSFVYFVSEAGTLRSSIKRCSYQKFIKFTGMKGIELASPNKNQQFLENTLYFKPRIALSSTCLQLTTYFKSKISLNKFTRIMS